MSPDLLDDLRAADPARRHPAPPDPDWGAMADRITASPRRARRRRRALILGPAIAVAAAAGAVVLVAGQPAGEVEVSRPAAPAGTPIYHYVVEFRELEGPDRRPVPDAHSTREGWVDPATGEVRETSPGGGPEPAPAPPVAAGGEPAAADKPDGTVLDALTRHSRIGPLRDEGLTTLDGRRVRRFVATNAAGDFRQTFFVDAETGFPVLFRTETGDHLRTGDPIPARQRIMEDRFAVFERLPDGTDRSVLERASG